MTVKSNLQSEIKLVVWMVTYNHEAYIEQAIESVMMQETDFKYQLLIGEDCSTDGTRVICQKLKAKYPAKIELYLHENNRGANSNGVFMYEKCFQSDAKYIALCEGDDYWTDPLKLQKQVDFLEANEDFSMCGSLATRSYDNPAIPNDVEGEAGIFEQKDLARRNFIPTATVLFRSSCITDYPKWLLKSPIGDWPLFLICLNHGKIKIFEEQMALRRVNAGGIWGANINGLNNDKNILTLISMFDVIRDKFNPDINGILNDNYLKQLIKLIELHLKNHRFDEVAQCLQVLLNEGRNISEESENMSTAITKKLTLQEQEINNLKMLNKQLINSNSYKLGRQITGVFSFLKKK